MIEQKRENGKEEEMSKVKFKQISVPNYKQYFKVRNVVI